MHPFWSDVIEPALDATGAERVVEIGVEQGRTTSLLLDRARRHGRGEVHGVDPAPQLDVSAWQLEWGGLFHFHRARSLECLDRLPPADAVLIDGDHNYYTVAGELAALRRAADELSRTFPLVIAHDTGWPYGRRDLYYAPGTIPEEHRHDAARAGLLPGRSELGEPGMNSTLWNATVEGGPRNGVLTAIEDFVANDPEPLTTVSLEGMHGLTLIASDSRLESTPELARFFDRLRSTEFLTGWTHALETARILAGMGPGTSDLGGASGRRDRVERDLGMLE
jgi:hypothetical protein